MESANMTLDLLSLFENLKGLSFIGLTTETEVKLKGGNSNPFKGRVIKRSRIGGFIYNTDKTNAYVNKVRKEIPDFEPKARKWGSRINNSPVIMHNGAQYLEIIIQSAKAEYLLDGELVERESIQGIESRNDGPHSVIIRDYSAESIKEIRFKGVEYK